MAVGELRPFVGEWSIEAKLEGVAPDAPKGTVTYEFMAGEEFLIQRWEVPIPEAPDGIAILGLQHYFDTRGVARVYEMSFDGRVWKLERTSEDFSPLHFRQRYVGTWEICHDGTTWEKDFDLVYERAG